MINITLEEGMTWPDILTFEYEGHAKIKMENGHGPVEIEIQGRHFFINGGDGGAYGICMSEYKP